MCDDFGDFGAGDAVALRRLQMICQRIVGDALTDERCNRYQAAVAKTELVGAAPYLAEKDIVATHETDILVVGCGTGGLFAVAAAAEAGGKVIGIDRFAVGTGIREDLGAIDSRYQKAWGTKIDKFEFITMATQYAGGHIQQDLVKLWCDKSGEAIDWVGDRLAERNIELWHESGDKNDETRYKHFAIGHSPKLPIDPKTGKFKITLAQVVEQYAAKKGARFDYNTKMVKLEKKNGRVTGVIAENADGKYVRYNAAKGVVVATGGYAQNWKMMEALQPWNLRIIGRSGALPGARGDGIRACLWAGAKMDETHSIMMFDRTAIRPDQQPGPDTVKSGDSGFFWIGSQPWLKVNADGRRFMNESGTYENILHADEYQKGHCHYTIFDSNWVKYAEQFKMHGCSRLFPFENGAEPNIPWEVFRDRMLPGLIAKGYVQKADTIEELAKKLGLPAAQLKATVARNNELYRKGADVVYDKLEGLHVSGHACHGRHPDQHQHERHRHRGQPDPGPLRHRQRQRRLLRQRVPEPRHRHGLRPHGDLWPNRGPHARQGLIPRTERARIEKGISPRMPPGPQEREQSSGGPPPSSSTFLKTTTGQGRRADPARRTPELI